MSFKAAVRHTGDVAIVDLAGRLTLGDGSGTIRNTIKDLVTKGDKKILLNLNEVTYLDSSGLGEMVGAYATVTNAGGEIKVMNTQRIHDLLQVTKLYTVFPDYNDEDTAVRSFGRGAGA
ncbi:MAG: anti-sigma factor antagonist [Terriglobia bacterium]|nr:MAG: anti-sigma factor antagonist [Terriglobia bacterium]